jgi:hypothetical protein
VSMLLHASLDSVSVCLSSFEVSRRSAPALDLRSVRAPVLSPLASAFLHEAGRAFGPKIGFSGTVTTGQVSQVPQ